MSLHPGLLGADQFLCLGMLSEKRRRLRELQPQISASVVVQVLNDLLGRTNELTRIARWIMSPDTLLLLPYSLSLTAGHLDHSMLQWLHRTTHCPQRACLQPSAKARSFLLDISLRRSDHKIHRDQNFVTKPKRLVTRRMHCQRPRKRPLIRFGHGTVSTRL